jgi:hypothetical protein
MRDEENSVKMLGTRRASPPNKSSKDKFIARARVIHKDRYSYDKVVYVDSKTKVIIICPDHGDFEQAATSHLSGVGCPTCCESKGEKKVAEVLQQLGIEFDREFRLPDCRGKRYPLPFDFCAWAPPDFEGTRYPAFIEYQGEQHYRPCSGIFKYDLVAEQHRDAIKVAFCERMNIPLLCISYKDASRIPELVTAFVSRKSFATAA